MSLSLKREPYLFPHSPPDPLCLTHQPFSPFVRTISFPSTTRQLWPKLRGISCVAISYFSFIWDNLFYLQLVWLILQLTKCKIKWSYILLWNCYILYLAPNYFYMLLWSERSVIEMDLSQIAFRYTVHILYSPTLAILTYHSRLISTTLIKLENWLVFEL